MADDKIYMPQSGGGLLRYNEEGGTKFRMSPQFVVVLIAIVIVLALLFHTGGFGLF